MKTYSSSRLFPFYPISVAILLLIFLTACITAPTPKESPVSTITNTLLPLLNSSPENSLPNEPTSTPTPEPVPSQPTPLATAGRIVLAGWSPKGQWVAFWTFTQETLEALPPNDGGPYDMIGILHFYDLASGQSCESPQLVSFRHPVFAWQDDGRAAVLGDDGTVRVSVPCEEAFDTLAGLEAQIAIGYPSLSPGHTFRAETTEVAFDWETGVQSNVTIVTKAKTGEEWGHVNWDVYLKLGFDNRVFWLTDDLLLIPETKERGPLLVKRNGEATEVTAELFGITGSCGGGLCASGMRAVAFSNPETGMYHLAMYWNWYQVFAPPLQTMLYHPESQEIETFGFQEVFGNTSISEANWWMMSRGDAFWARMLDPAGGRLIQFQPGEWPALSPDGGKAAFGTKEGALWVQTLPERETLGYWDLNPLEVSVAYWSLAWSPDGEKIAVIPSWYDGRQNAALYLLDCCNGPPTNLPPTLTPTPTQPPGPTAEASQIPSIDLARGTLLTFFNLLHLDQLGEAYPLYEGAYENLQLWNPDIDPADHESLFARVCQNLQCLLIKNVSSQAQISPDEFHFVVEFMLDDGSLYVLGPCCGASEEDMPPVSQFEYTVVLGLDGQYRVTGLPVYVP